MTTWEGLVEAGHLQPELDLGSLTTYKLGGSATWGIEAEDPEMLSVVVAGANERGLQILLLGRGSNVVVADKGFAGVAVRLGGTFREISFHGDGVVEAGAGVPLAVLARTAASEGLGGTEFYVGIPGSVGGAVAMNAGFHGGETAEILTDALVMDIRTAMVTTRSNEELDFAYRHSSVGEFDAVLSGRFKLAPADTATALARMRELTQWRKDNQPGGTFNAGSVFKNPPGDHAGRLIDHLGLKGMSCGGASVSDRHANFFVADPAASSQDVFDLVHAVQQAVHSATGVFLEPELRFVGSFDPPPGQVT